MSLIEREERFVMKAGDRIVIDSSKAHGRKLLTNRQKQRAVNRPPLNRAALVRTVAAEVGISQAKAEIVVRAILEAIRDALTKGEDVQLARFGTFRAVILSDDEAQDHSVTGLEFLAAKSLREAVS